MKLLKDLFDLFRPLFPYLLAFTVIYTFRNDISEVLLPRVQSLKFGNLEITFLKNSVKKIASKRANLELSDEDATSPFLRARGIAPILKGARLLWIDDNPENNENEARVLRKLGIEVDTAMTSAEARKMLSRFNYDAILSDIKREGKEYEGMTFLKSLVKSRLFRYTIFYEVELVHDKLPVTEEAFGITDRPDKLLHLVMDVLERERWELVG